MLRVLFGEITSGRVGRLGYLGYALLLVVLMMGVLVAVMVAAGVVGSDTPPATGWALLQQVRASLGLPTLVAAAVVLAGITFAKFNLSAKRWRAMGLPGWLMIVFSAAASGALEFAFGQLPVAIFGWVMLLALLLVPNDALARFGRRG
ncbi:MAG: hypothetical protein AAFX81_01310 [Pseudomonadota bacterium]